MDKSTPKNFLMTLHSIAATEPPERFCVQVRVLCQTLSNNIIKLQEDDDDSGARTNREQDETTDRPIP